MTKTNVPRLRFRGFSGEWKNDILENNVNFVQGNDGTDKGLPVLTISAGKGWMNQKDRFGTVLAGNELKNYTLLKKGQLSYNHGNSKLAEYGAVFCLRNYDKALVPRVYHSFELKNGDSNFIEKLFESKIPDRQLRKLITSGARMDGLLNINKKAFGSISLNFPSQYEQQKIGSFFTRMDKIIELQIQKLEQLKKLKHGYLQKMFPQDGESIPRLRFSGFSGGWKKKNISEITTRLDNKRVPVKEQDRVSGNVPYYGANGIQGYVESFTHTGNNILIAEDGASDVNNYPVIFTKGNIWVNNHAHVLQSKDNKSDSSFMSYALKLIRYEKYLTGNGRYKLNADVLMKINLLVPSIGEQQKISKFFSKLDQFINNQSKKIDSLKQQKKAYLQKMFI
ncbi:restriction endonuclease subunit S [Apilactobacillus kunkeei]|uniref:Type IC HsdS subunit n=1 Tax=Apilactobacillus kunkeei TaxID=148814 RepID=A0A0P7L4U5_9LACO|nr:restriction endonuclease subunit S [Apilactobacillus kunkeei]KPN83469.1 Type IC HsdS subunit [Apilactobacillus kunkeei]